VLAQDGEDALGGLRESFFTLGPGGGELRGARFEVMMRTVFLKSTVRPLESVRRPSSRTWRRTLKTSAWAFSISSKRMTA